MIITNTTYCGKKETGGYSRVKAWSNEVANDLQIGHHRPTLEQLNAKGWMVYVDTAYDSGTEKLAIVFTDDGSIISKAKTNLPAEEIFNKKVALFRNSVQVHLDALAVSWGYDHILSLCSYDGNSDPQYSAEGSAGKTWRSETWRFCEVELGKIAINERPEPESVEAFIAELPIITRPIV